MFDLIMVCFTVLKFVAVPFEEFFSVSANVDHFDVTSALPFWNDDVGMAFVIIHLAAALVMYGTPY